MNNNVKIFTGVVGGLAAITLAANIVSEPAKDAHDKSVAKVTSEACLQDSQKTLPHRPKTGRKHEGRNFVCDGFELDSVRGRAGIERQRVNHGTTRVSYLYMQHSAEDLSNRNKGQPTGYVAVNSVTGLGIQQNADYLANKK